MKFLLISIFVGSYFSWSAGNNRTASSVGSCQKADAARDILDNFCPRAEGVHLEGCCPPVEKLPATTCIYHIFKASGQPKRVNSTYQFCNGTSTQTGNCCRTTQVGCYTDEVRIPFIARLIYRNNSCCFEFCPSSQYWTSPPNPRTDITRDHQYTGGGVNGCVAATIESCDYGSEDNCPADEPCPPPECTVNCGGSTSGGSGSSSTSGGTTGGGTDGGSSGGSTTGGTTGGDPGST